MDRMQLSASNEERNATSSKFLKSFILLSALSVPVTYFVSKILQSPHKNQKEELPSSHTKILKALQKMNANVHAFHPEGADEDHPRDPLYMLPLPNLNGTPQYNEEAIKSYYHAAYVLIWSLQKEAGLHRVYVNGIPINYRITSKEKDDPEMVMSTVESPDALLYMMKNTNNLGKTPISFAELLAWHFPNLEIVGTDEAHPDHKTNVDEFVKQYVVVQQEAYPIITAAEEEEKRTGHMCEVVKAADGSVKDIRIGNTHYNLLDTYMLIRSFVQGLKRAQQLQKNRIDIYSLAVDGIVLASPDDVIHSEPVISQKRSLYTISIAGRDYHEDDQRIDQHIQATERFLNILFDIIQKNPPSSGNEFKKKILERENDAAPSSDPAPAIPKTKEEPLQIRKLS